jgi:hypothetical protein
MLDYLMETEKAHRAIVETLEMIHVRVLAAMHQAFPDEAAS